MDPLSAIASVIAVVQASDRTLSLLASLKHVKDAPKEVSVLIDDLSELKSAANSAWKVVTQIHETDLWNSAEAQGLVSVVDSLRKHVLSLEEILQYALLDPLGQVRRISWMTNRGKVSSVRQMIERDTSTATMHMARLNLIASIKIASDIEAIMSTSVAVQSQQELNLRLLHDRFDDHEKLLRQVALGQREPLTCKSILPPTYNHDAGLSLPSDKIPPDTEISIGSQPKQLVKSEGASYCPSSASTCEPQCLCQCHRHRSTVNPRSLFQGLRALAFEYVKAFYSSSSVCNLKTCKRRAFQTMSMGLSLPSWLSASQRYALLNVSFGPAIGATVSFPRLLSPQSEIFEHIRQGNCEMIHEMFQAGLASPSDIHAGEGKALLTYALAQNQLEVCSLLLDWGANPMAPDRADYYNNPSQLAYLLARCSLVEAAGEAELLGLFPPPDQDYMQLSTVHKCVVNTSATVLESSLKSSLSSIDEVDILGWTALHWAAWIGDSAKVEVLLRHGARSDIKEKRGRTALSLVCTDDAHDCARLLITYGADPNAQDIHGETALHSATRLARALKVLTLLASDPKTDVNAIDYDGDTAIWASLAFDNFQGIQTLLEHGADPNIQSYQGVTPIQRAIVMHANKSLPILLDGGARCDIIDNEHDTVLHFAAKFADQESLETLQKHELFRSSSTLRNMNGYTAEEEFSYRAEQESLSSEHIAAFHALVAAVRQREARPGIVDFDIDRDHRGSRVEDDDDDNHARHADQREEEEEEDYHDALEEVYSNQERRF